VHCRVTVHSVELGLHYIVTVCSVELQCTIESEFPNRVTVRSVESQYTIESQFTL
jgi:hypothetical protein